MTRLRVVWIYWRYDGLRGIYDFLRFGASRFEEIEED